MSHAEKSDLARVSQLVGSKDSSNAQNESVNRLCTDGVSPHFSTGSFEILRRYGGRRLQLDAEWPNTSHGMQSAQTSSTEATIRVAAEKFIQFCGSSSNELFVLDHHPQGGNCDGVRLIQNLLFCAERVADCQYELALEFLKGCEGKSLATGTPIQRLAFYFSRALFEKIANETGRSIKEKDHDPVESVFFPDMNLLASFQREHPLAQVTKLVGIEAVLDHVKQAKKLHMIDLQIRSGVQWIILMQDLAARDEHRVQSLKITAVGVKWESRMEETGRQLSCFARSLSLEFSFKTVVLEDFLELDHSLFDVDDDESVAVYAPYVLSSFVGRANELDHLMKTVRILNPCVMIVTELEVNCNSPSFIDRFVESLFFFGSFFDSLEECFEGDEASRGNAEASWFGSAIRNILAADGEERRLRHVSIGVWRAFFARFGLAETELSTSSLDQAHVGLQSLPRGRSCTLFKDGKCFTLGWKGNPLSSVSAWKFQ